MSALSNKSGCTAGSDTKGTGVVSGVTTSAPPPCVGGDVAAGVSGTLLPAVDEARDELVEVGDDAALSAAAALVTPVLSVYAGCSTVKELLTGDSPGAS